MLENVPYLSYACMAYGLQFTSGEGNHVYNLHVCLSFTPAEGMTCLYMQPLSLIQGFLIENTQCIPRCHHDNVERATM